MYAYLKGIVAMIEEDNCIIEVNGIGMNVRISASTASMLPPIGSETMIYTYTSVREDSISLIGFLSMSDLQMFKQLITVNGIGPKGGLSLLSAMDASTIRIAILTGDVNTLAKAPGVGKKSAERVILELKGKVDQSELLSFGNSEISNRKTDTFVDSDNMKEAAEALSALGYSMADSVKAIRKIDGADSMDVETILKLALKELY